MHWKTPRMSIRHIVLATAIAVPTAAPTVGQDADLGYRDGRRAVVSRGPDEEIPIPDVLEMLDGTRLEAYFLAQYDERVVFFLRAGERLWHRHVVPASEVRSIDPGRHLERDPVGATVIRRATKQPVVKEDLLAGVFHGRRGRFAAWRIVFQSDVDKIVAYSEDATEFGRFTAESTYHQPLPGERRKPIAHATRATGTYHLYRPHTISNKDWVLVVTDVIQNQTDYQGHRTLDQRVIPREAFIVNFDGNPNEPGGAGFRLEWANIGSSTWAALTQVRFTRGATRPPTPVHRLLPSSAAKPVVLSVGRSLEPTRRSARAPRATPGLRRWRTGWGRAPSRLGTPSWRVH